MTKEKDISPRQLSLPLRFFRLKGSPSKKDGEKVIGKSATEPDDSYTIMELFDRHRAGLITRGRESLDYFGRDATHDDVDPRQMDFFETHERATAAVERSREAFHKNEAVKKNRDRKKTEDAIREQIERETRERSEKGASDGAKK